MSSVRCGGWPSSAAFFILESVENISDVRIEQRVIALIEPILIDMGYELVRVALLGKQALTLQIMVDRADGSLINVEDCEQISHAVSAVMDVHDPMEGAWTLEVSSAGIDRPLVRVKDWNRCGSSCQSGNDDSN